MDREERTDMNFEVAWTLDGETWHTRWFDFFSAAQRFARELVDGNDGNRSFTWYAKRAVTLACEDVLDAACAVDVTVVDRVTLPEGYLGEGR